ncbi:MAG: co-chaperone GroES [Thermodesulfovibrionales bacterium]
MKIKPLHDWVVIRATESEERTAGGIFIPEAAKEKPQWGIVESAGPGRYEPEDNKDVKGKKKFVATEVKPGDNVLFEKYMAREFTIDHEKVVMVRESSVLGTLERGGTSHALQTKGPAALEKKGPSALQKKEAGAVAPVKKTAEKKEKKK